MSCYFIAQISVHDISEYQKYIDKAGEIFSKFNGEYLVVDDDPILLEGNWDGKRTVLIKFEKSSDFNKWYYSEAYQEILKYRLKAAHCNTILAKGMD